MEIFSFLWYHLYYLYIFDISIYNDAKIQMP